MNPMSHIKTTPYKMYIDGKFVESISGKTREATNPANNEVFASYYYGDIADAKLAVEAARRAYDEGPWRRMSGKERGRLLIKAGEILERRKEDFVVTETMDAGKVYMSALYYEAVQSVDAFLYSGGKAQQLEGKVVPIDADTLNYVVWQPHGVVAEILPWNGPFMMGCQKASTILAAGNTAVIKSASDASLTMLLLAEVFDEAGFPPGVINFITGPGRTVGDYLVKSEQVDMVAMTGSTETGRYVIEASKDTIKDIALELGGKSPVIVFDDINTDEVAKWARYAFTLNAGQVCVSGTRLIVQRGIYEELLAKLKVECEKMVPGDGFDVEGGVNHPALINKPHADSVWAYIQRGKDAGARLICGGVPYTDPKLEKGNFIPVTVFADVTPDMEIFQEEIFGPVLCVTPFDTEEEALKIANGTKFGLAGAVFSHDGKRALRVAQQIDGGQIYVNHYFSRGMMESPATGWKESGLGPAGIQKYMISKTIFVDLKDGSLPF
ncbi:aldehyde dehydrogenase family protein [Eubacteriales bacterium OttesenSCG-928-N14]|nr:aldehyde dehydrogenase family protein [Eubacteriales bacterium OttesenSCG-928-N14]